MNAEQEVRLRCLEAAARNPTPHKDGYAAGVLEAAQQYTEFVTHGGRVEAQSPVLKPVEVGDFL